MWRDCAWVEEIWDSDTPSEMVCSIGLCDDPKKRRAQTHWRRIGAIREKMERQKKKNWGGSKLQDFFFLKQTNKRLEVWELRRCPHSSSLQDTAVLSARADTGSLVLLHLRGRLGKCAITNRSGSALRFHWIWFVHSRTFFFKRTSVWIYSFC